mgnify:CR=1 FL=1
MIGPGDWRYAYFWAIVAVSAPVLACTIAFIVGEFIGKLTQ